MRSSILTLQSQLNEARERLKDVEDTIKKSTGRLFPQNTNARQGVKRSVRQLEEGEIEAPLKKRISDVKGRLGDWVTDDRSPAVTRPGFQRGQRVVTRPFQQPWQRDLKSEESLGRIPARKRLDAPLAHPNQALTVFSRLSGPPKEEDVEKVKITSQVLVQEAPSRKEILAAQSKDKSCKERNRRMFGALMGTLQKFRQEESKLKEKEEKKAQVERKVEEAAEREKEEAMKHRRELFTSRRQEQLNIRHLEFKLDKLKQLGEWESNKKKLMPFIQTNAQPRIFYLPKKHNTKTRKLLETHQISVQKAIDKKRLEIEKLIEDHMPPAESKDDRWDNEDQEEMPLMPSAVVKTERGSDSSEDEEEVEQRGGETDSDSTTPGIKQERQPSIDRPHEVTIKIEAS